MIQRCYDSNFPYYYRYGGRGITVCEQWRSSIENFYADMGPKPTRDHSLDRIDNDGNYSPENCRWATCKEQLRNTRANHLITYNGETLCITEWAEQLGMRPNALGLRIAKGWTIERALTQPVRFRPRRKD